MRRDPIRCGRQYDPRVLCNRIHRGRRCALLVAVIAAVVATAASGTANAASAGSVAVIVVPTFGSADYAARGAVGLLVPGAGATVSRERALASLLSGRVVSSLVELDGEPVLKLATVPAETTIYVALPPPGSSQNAARYPVAIVGPGYEGLLTSDSTRIDGLVSLADIAPTAAAIAAGASPRIQARVDPRAAATLARLDIALTNARDARKGATVALVAWLVVFSVVALMRRSAVAGRAALFVAPVALGTAVVLRAIGIDDPTVVVVALAVVVGVASLLLGLRSEALVPAVVSLLFLFLLTLAVWPEVNALAAIGPHPDGGGRFFGVTNQVSTLLLAPSLAAAVLAGVVGAAAVGLLLLVTIGWSRTGADGGGVLVTATAFAVLLAGMTRSRLTPLRIVVGVLGVVSLGLAIVGLDGLIGGSSHVTDAVGGGPGGLFDDIERRLRISWAGATSAWHTVLLCLLALAGLGWLGWRRRRSVVTLAMLAGLGVSVIVNDTPVDVLGYGALGLLALTAWDETRALDRPVESRGRPSALQPRETS